MSRKKVQHVGKILFSILSVLLGFLGILLFTSSRWMLATWAHLDMEELVYHLKAPLEGTSKDVLWSYVWSCGMISFAVLAILIALFIILRHRKKVEIILGCICIALGIALSSYSLYNVWTTLDIDTYLHIQNSYSTLIEDNYVNPSQTTITFPEKKRNLIYIYLESMESTYSDKKDGGAYDHNFIPALTNLALDNINFSNSDKLGGAYPTTGTTWTMGGLFAQTSGLPLKLSIQGNEMAYQDSFFPQLSTLGDVLNEAGYKQYFMMGSDAAFGGRKNYFTSHGDYEIDDYYWAISEGLIPEGYYQWWGYEDAKLFEYAKDKLTEISKNDEPFNFSMLTVATHFEDGYKCDECDEKQYGDDHYGMVIDCSSSRVSEFIDWIKEQPFYENTTIILSGDHLTMDSDFCENIDEDYLGMNKTTSTSVATRVESEVAVSDNTVWNDSENSTSDYTEEDSDDEYAYISGADKVIDEVYGTVWDGWENDDPDHPELDEITYGMVMDYLFEDSTYYSWYYDDTTGNVIMEGTYTTFDYTMGMADEPTACDVKLTFTVDNGGNWFVSDYSGDEFDTADEFLQVAYDFYYEGNRLL